MLLQAYDFVQLHDQHGCELQAGGSDQWGNITAGIDLARRLRGVQFYGCTCPLLTKSDGTKMGKTESGALWLSADKTSPYQFYQYWINLDDADVGRCLRFFTDLGKEEIDALLAEHPADRPRTAQHRLASELTHWCTARGLDKALEGHQYLVPLRHRGFPKSKLRMFAEARQGTSAGATRRCGLAGRRRLCRVGPVQDQERGPADHHPGRGLREQPPCRGPRNPPNAGRFGKRNTIVLRSGKRTTLCCDLVGRSRSQGKGLDFWSQKPGVASLLSGVRLCADLRGVNVAIG